MASLNKFIELLTYYCDVASVGYDQYNRWAVYDGGECDCSSLVITCLKEAGFDVGNATYTGNMSSELCARGWQRLTPTIANAKPGDILLNDANHVAAVVNGNGWSAKVAQASIDEHGNISGGAAGDQTGFETNISPIYNYPWDCILRFTGSESDYGWIQDEKGWWYKNPDGSCPSDCWQFIEDAWYFFDANGYMREDWLLWDGEFYYLEPGTGIMVTGWKYIKDHWYWFERNGIMVSNCFTKVEGKWYGFDKDGQMITSLNQCRISSKGAITFK